MNALLKISAIYGLRIFNRIFHVFPIKKNRIIINAYRGSQYSCNPKYISEYLTKTYKGKLEIIWAFNKPENFQFLEEDGIRLVKYSSLRRFFYEATAKISINNIGSYSWLPLRRGQEHINTWHAGFGYKKIGLGEIANSKTMKRTIQISSDETTLIPSCSKEFTNEIARKDLGYQGNIIDSGLARNDILFKQLSGKINIREKVLTTFGIDKNTYIVLYAPTWRYDRDKQIPALDYNMQKKALEDKTGKTVVILSRMHHLSEFSITDKNLTIDATKYPDMQELLAAADCLITDYSSSIWDFSIMERPIFIYAPDIEEYRNQRGYHMDVFEWGFPVCQNNFELCSAIQHLNEEDAKKMAISHRMQAGSFEDGSACEQIGQWIYKKCFY